MTETLGFVTGALAVWLLVRESIWTWPAGIANAGFFLVLFAEARFFADSALQLVYIALGVWGWWYWRHGAAGRRSRPIARVRLPETVVLAAATVAASYGMYLYLRSVGDSAPLADAVTTALSLAATWMQARKLIENWLVWLAADAIYIPLYAVKDLPLTAVLYVVFALMCVKGWRDWRRTIAARGSRPWAQGVVLGKFLPFHTGHEHLIRTALGRVRNLTVIVVARGDQAIPGATRGRWIEEAFPDARVVVLDQDEVGLADHDTDGWARETIRAVGRAPDVVFTSEDYGDAWAAAMGAEHVLVDRRRRAVPISATRIRRDPQRHFEYLSRGARAHYVKRVVLLGAESTGKTTLARALAEHYGTVWNPEFGHVYSWFRAEPADDWASWTTGEFVEIAQTQNWYEDFMATQARRVLFCDTSAWTTNLFHELYLGERSAEVDRLAGREYDLAIVCDPMTPFAQDEFGARRDGPHRAAMHEAYIRHLDETGARYVVVAGTHAQRMQQATAAVDALLAEPAVVAA
jgi:NadR type nicotinamide-nucleotide adenylyltransferase